MKKYLHTLFFLFFFLFGLFLIPKPAFAIGTFNSSDVTIDTHTFQFNSDISLNGFAAAGVQCDEGRIFYHDNPSLFTTSGNTVTYNAGDPDFSTYPGHNCRVLLYTNNGGNDWISNQIYSLPATPPLINVTGFEYLPCSPDCRTLVIHYDNFPAPDMGLINVDSNGNFISGAYGSTSFTNTEVVFTIPNNNQPWDQYMQLSSSNGGLSRILNLLDTPTPTPTPVNNFSISNLTFNQSTRHYSFDYTGYTAGDITGESTAIHADDESWGYNHEPATCTGGASGSGTCTGTFNYPHGNYSCSGTIYVQVYGYHPGAYIVHGLANPDPSCTTPVGSEDSNGFAFSPLVSPVSSYTFTYHNLTSTTVGVVGFSTSGITWSAISSPACTTAHLYNGGTNPGAEGCTILPGSTAEFTVTPLTPLTTEPSDLGYEAASYDTNSGFATGQYNLVDGYSDGFLTWSSPTPTPTPTPTPVNNFAVSNLTFDQSTLQYSFDYTGYTGGNVTGESTALHAENENWGYNHEPATCTGGTSGSGTCTGTFNYIHGGPYSCADSIYVQIYGYNAGGFIARGVPNPDPACATPSFVVSNVSVDHTTGEFNFDYTGYNGGSIVAVSLRNDAAATSYNWPAGEIGWGPLSCTGSHCSGSPSHATGVISCSNNLIFDIFDGTAEYYSNNFTVSDIDPSCSVTPTPVPNQAPVVSFNVSGGSINEGEEFTATGSFTDPDSASWTATVDYGDGSGVQSLPLTGQTFSLSHVYVDNGTYTITVSVTDNGNLTGTSTGSGGGIVVNNSAPVIPPVTPPSNVGQNSPAVINVNFTDYGNQSHTATVNWGDGSGNQSVPISGNDFSSNHNYTNPGTYTVTIVVTDSQGATTTQTLTITVLNVAPQLGTISAPSDPVETHTDVNTSVNFTDPGVIDTHTAVWDWGDGNTSVGTVTEASGSGSVTGTHQYNSGGTYMVKVTVTDNNGGSSEKTKTVTIVVNQPPYVNPISGAVLNVGETYAANGSFTDSDSASWTATVDYDDGAGPEALTLNGNNFSLSHQYATVGTYTVRVVVKDNKQNTGTTLATVVVQRQLTTLAPVGIWVGLKNSDDVGVKFDLLAEAYKDGVLVSSGQLNSFAGGSSGFNNAHLATIPFNNFSALNFPTGSVLSIKVSVRNACTGSTHNSGYARLWFNDSQANSGFTTTIGDSSFTEYLRDGFVLAGTTGSTKKTIDVQSGAKCSAFKTFGTWTITP